MNFIAEFSLEISLLSAPVGGKNDSFCFENVSNKTSEFL